MSTLLVYITGHGFGHARRVYAMLREIQALRADVNLVIRTSAPGWIFADLPRTRVLGFATGRAAVPNLDFGVLENDAITIDVAGSLAQARSLLAEAQRVISAEVALMEDLQPAGVLADIPYLAGSAVAAYRTRTGRRVPAGATGNFTWDYMYERMSAAGAELAAKMRAGYAHFDVYLRLPFSHATAAFGRIVDLPLVANLPRVSRARTLQRLGIADSARPRVLLGMRGGMEDGLIISAVARCPEYDFFTRGPVAKTLPKNLRAIDPPADIDFSDLLAACDVCLSKLGYGLAADAAVAGCALLWPPRRNFFEDALFDPLLGQIARHRMIAREAFLAGDWAADLRELLAQTARPWPELDGTRRAAELLLHELRLP